MPRRRLLVACLPLFVACASGPSVSPRVLLARSMGQLISLAPVSSSTRIWLTNQEDSECHSSCGQAACAPQEAPRGSPMDVLAHEVFTNVITAQKWGALIEGHRHNYATDFKPETHRVVTVGGDEKSPRTSSSCEDLCLLDEAKKRNSDKVLVYEILSHDSVSVLIHFQLSDVRSGRIELAKTLRVFEDSVKDWSQ